MTNELMVEGLKLSRNESLMVTFHANSGKWLASVGDLRAEYQREIVSEDTPIAALAELLLLIGGKVQGAN